MTTADEMGLTPEAARDYESFFVPAIFHQWPARIAAMAELQAGHRVLDVGCGTGILTRELVRHVGERASVVGIDLSESMLSVARDQCPGVEFRHANATALPFPDHSFDAVVSSFMLMFVPDPEQALREMYRVLTPGGRLVLSVWQALEQNPMYAALVDTARSVLGEESAESLAWPFALGRSGQLATLFEAAGISRPTLTEHDGSATFPSLEDYVRTEIQSWLLADSVSESQIDTIVAKLSSQQLDRDSASGSVSFACNAILAAVKRA